MKPKYFAVILFATIAAPAQTAIAQLAEKPGQGALLTAKSFQQELGKRMTDLESAILDARSSPQKTARIDNEELHYPSLISARLGAAMIFIAKPGPDYTADKARWDAKRIDEMKQIYSERLDAISKALDALKKDFAANPDKYKFSPTSSEIAYYEPASVQGVILSADGSLSFRTAQKKTIPVESSELTVSLNLHSLKNFEAMIGKIKKR